MVEAGTRYADVTVVVTQRERFSFTRESLASIYEQTPGLANVVYVDGGSPKHVRSFLEEQSRERGFRLIRTRRYLSPSQARNIGLRAVTTKYVVFIDNDVLVEPGWLDQLVACADETGAAIVGPLYLQSIGKRSTIHMAGGVARIDETSGRRMMDTYHLLAHQPPPEPGSLSRAACSLVEFHAMLVRTSIFAEIGELDEAMLSLEEHTDLCLLVTQHGGTIFFEPASRITYVIPKRLEPSDLPFFALRWSERWNRESAASFCKKWNLDASDPHERELIDYGRHYRLRALRVVRERPGGPLFKKVRDKVASLAERALNSAYTAGWSPIAPKMER